MFLSLEIVLFKHKFKSVSVCLQFSSRTKSFNICWWPSVFILLSQVFQFIWPLDCSFWSEGSIFIKVQSYWWTGEKSGWSRKWREMLRLMYIVPMTSPSVVFLIVKMTVMVILILRICPLISEDILFII